MNQQQEAEKPTELGSCETISECIAVLERWKQDAPELWFRGHARDTYRLLPGIFRQGSGYQDLIMDEAGMYREFLREFPEHRTAHRTEIEWLTLMQHYGIPTRLLDWTTSLLVGLYFAVATGDGADGIVWALKPNHFWGDASHRHVTPLHIAQIEANTWQDLFLDLCRALRNQGRGPVKINGIDIDQAMTDPIVQVQIMMREPRIVSMTIEHKNTVPVMDLSTGVIQNAFQQEIVRHLSSVVAVRAPKLNSRLIAQHGVFTFHGGKFLNGIECIETRALEDYWSSQQSIASLRIPAEAKPRLLRELEVSGVFEASIFPDFEFRAKRIRALHARSQGRT